MSDRLQTGGNSDRYTHLRAAYDRAKSLQETMQIKDQHIPNNIKRHRHVPILAPKGPWRDAPDRHAFMAREAQDRKTALRRNNSLQNQQQIDKPLNRGLER